VKRGSGFAILAGLARTMTTTRTLMIAAKKHHTEAK
jgi:hypothetical protein